MRVLVPVSDYIAFCLEAQSTASFDVKHTIILFICGNLGASPFELASAHCADKAMLWRLRRRDTCNCYEVDPADHPEKYSRHDELYHIQPPLNDLLLNSFIYILCQSELLFRSRQCRHFCLSLCVQASEEAGERRDERPEAGESSGVLEFLRECGVLTRCDTSDDQQPLF